MKTFEKILSVMITPLLLLAFSFLSLIKSDISDFNWWLIISTALLIIAINSLMLIFCPQTIPQANNCWLVLCGMVACLSTNIIYVEDKVIFAIMSIITLIFTVFVICLPEIVRGAQLKAKQKKS